jgi:malonyl-CoA decarboxylase
MRRILRRGIHHLKSSIIKQYWDDVLNYSHRPEFYNPMSSTTHSQTNIQKLVQQIVKSRREDGDIWPTLLCKQFCEFYTNANLNQRARILTILGAEFGLDQEHINKSIESYQKQQHKQGRPGVLNLAKLRSSLEPAYESLFNRISQLPGGLLFLVHMRSHCLHLLNRADLENDAIQNIETHLKLQFQIWFGATGMELEKISWKSPAHVLEKIVAYEAVHKIRTWEDLKQRLGPGRICFSFFHPAIPHEPLTFVQVALLDQIPSTIEEILQDPNPGTDSASVAIFYSITSSQKGLQGVDLGHFLIKRVIKETQTTMPFITTFCTLSPIPNFRNWIETILNEEIYIAYPDHCTLPRGIQRLLLSDELKLLQQLPNPPESSNLKNIFEVFGNNVALFKKGKSVSSKGRNHHEACSRASMQSIYTLGKAKRVCN